MCVDFTGPVLYHEKHKPQSSEENISSILFSLAFSTAACVTADIHLSRCIYSSLSIAH